MSPLFHVLNNDLIQSEIFSHIDGCRDRLAYLCATHNEVLKLKNYQIDCSRLRTMFFQLQADTHRHCGNTRAFILWVYRPVVKTLIMKLIKEEILNSKKNNNRFKVSSRPAKFVVDFWLSHGTRPDVLLEIARWCLKHYMTHNIYQRPSQLQYCRTRKIFGYGYGRTEPCDFPGLFTLLNEIVHTILFEHVDVLPEYVFRNHMRRWEWDVIERSPKLKTVFILTFNNGIRRIAPTGLSVFSEKLLPVITVHACGY